MLAVGEHLGPYEVVSPLGAGGMGEVYRARDPRLGREVAVKVLPEALADDPDRLKRFEREARAAAALAHPNVLTVFDVGQEGERTYLVFELLEGSTLAEVMKEAGLRTREALDCAAQVARGLAAAHARGIVHRDIKPANLLLTPSGVVKILDFGLARIGQAANPGASESTAEVTGPGVALGTVSYMSPEQVKGHAVDGRSDLFSLGVVLYELVSGRHPFRRASSAETLSAILRDEPPALAPIAGRVPEPIERLVARCLEKRPEDRFQTAGDLAIALDLLARGEAGESRGSGRRDGGRDERPYPGLSAFTEADAAQFFGREDEVQAFWEKVREQKLLAVIGPSGVGKTSFLRAGVLAVGPADWATVYVTPGASPAVSLARALTPELAGDADAMASLLEGVRENTSGGAADAMVSAIARWRSRHQGALLVLDQFEELFTQNGAEAAARFAKLVGRFAREVDVHVVLAVRDDYLFRCGEHEGLRPVFHELTPLYPPTAEALKRALVEPSARLGFRFEDHALVEEILDAVKGERGALPLVAFAVSRLWEKRDREKKLLTRDAYRALGGVAGALAQHAEATLERIGREREDLVREIFRSLTTADGTRADLDRADLLSRFPERSAAERVLDELVGARLLTAYEGIDTGGVAAVGSAAGGERVEIVHESLLRAWPRLVRWQTQDEGGAQLREQLLQAARLWEERGRAEDLLWSGRSYREFALWRERNPQPLGAREEAFGRAMTARATRRRRRRRMATTGVVAVAASVASLTSALWVRAERARTAALAELHQREAAQLVSLGRLRLEDQPSAALAHAIASLERADNAPARLLALEALWKGPPLMAFDGNNDAMTSAWSADGRWLALGSWTGLTLHDRDTGRRYVMGRSAEHPVGFSADSTRLVSRSQGAASQLHLWSLPEGRLLETWPPAERLEAFLIDRRLLTFLFDDTNPPPDRAATVWERSIDGGPQKSLGRWRPRGLAHFAIDPAGERLFSLQGGRLLEQGLHALLSSPRVLGRQDGASWVAAPQSGRLLTAGGGEVRLWDAATGRVERALRSPAETRRAFLDPLGRFVAASPANPGPEGPLVLFDLQAPRAADEFRLLQRMESVFTEMAFYPRGGWLASRRGLWNLDARRATVLRGQKGAEIGVAFTSDGRLVSTSNEGVVRLWFLEPEAVESVRELWAERPSVVGLFVVPDPKDRFVAFGKWWQGQIVVQPLGGSPTRQFQLRGRAPTAMNPQLDPGGRRVAVFSLEFGSPEASSLRVLDLESGDERELRVQDAAGTCAKALARLGPVDQPTWLPDGRLVSDGVTGLRVWDLATGSSRQVRPCRPAWDLDWNGIHVKATPDGHEVVTLLVGAGGSLEFSVANLTTGTSRDITSHGTALQSFALDPSGRVLVTGGRDGLVRVGPLTGEEPHLLYGHTQGVGSVAVSPDGKWIASASSDDTIRLWPMPEGRPLQTLPLEELLARLRSLTNLRVVPDPAAATGYKVEVGPFPAWAKAPEW